MESLNHHQELSTEDEENIIREVFPELSTESESERGRYPALQGQMRSGQRGYGSYRRNMRQFSRAPRYSGHTHFRARRGGWNAGYAGMGGRWGSSYLRQAGSGWNTPYGSPQWAQYALGQTIGPWVGSSGRMDPVTRRALRIFQSRYRLPVTGGLDNDTLQALLNAVNQQAPPPDAASAAPPPDSNAPPDVGSPAVPPPDNPPDQGQPPQDNPPPDGAPGEFSDVYLRETMPYRREKGRRIPSTAVTYPVNRNSLAYVKWYQSALNKILPATLAVDGRYGPKTRAMVRVFQSRNALKTDGLVGPLTEAALIRAGAPLPPRAAVAPVQPGTLPISPTPNVPCGPSPTLSASERDVLSVTSTLEGGRPFHCAVSATDGISMGSMQWNLAAGTLQTMLARFEKGTSRLTSYFGTDTDRLKRLIDRQQTSLADAVSQATAEKLAARWHDPLSRLCADPFMCGLQQADIASRLCVAWDNFSSLNLTTVRGLSMCYDIINGDGAGGMASVRARALAMPAWSATSEAEKLVNLANFAADRLSKYREERRARRLNLANVPTPYRGTPATPGRSYADQINRTVPNLDRALTTADKTVCQKKASSHREYESMGLHYGHSRVPVTYWNERMQNLNGA